MDDTQWRTHRLELDDQTLREWEATVLAADAEGIVLDRSAFYPRSEEQRLNSSHITPSRMPSSA